MKKLILSISTVLLLICGCSKNEPGSGGSASTGLISGSIVSENGTPIAGVKVSTSVSTTTTDGSGKFSLSYSGAIGEIIKVEAIDKDHYPGYKNLENIDNSSISTEIILISKANIGTLNSTQGGTLQGTNIKIIAPSNGFSNTDGTAFAGLVKVSAKLISPNDPKFAEMMPGGDFLATNSAGQEGGMQSFGFIATEFTDQNGNLLKPNAGVQAAITIPSGIPNPVANNGKAWSYNSNTGKWDSESNITMISNEVYFDVSQTTFRNCDAFREFAEISGVYLCDGKPQANKKIKISDNTYIAYYTMTNGNGKYKARVLANLAYNLVAEGADPKSTQVLTANQKLAVNLECKAAGGSSFPDNTIEFDGKRYPLVGAYWSGKDLIKITYIGNGTSTDTFADVRLDIDIPNNFKDSVISGKVYNLGDWQVSAGSVNTFSFDYYPLGIKKTYNSASGTFIYTMNSNKKLLEIDALLYRDQEPTIKKPVKVKVNVQ